VHEATDKTSSAVLSALFFFVSKTHPFDAQRKKHKTPFLEEAIHHFLKRYVRWRPCLDWDDNSQCQCQPNGKGGPSRHPSPPLILSSRGFDLAHPLSGTPPNSDTFAAAGGAFILFSGLKPQLTRSRVNGNATERRQLNGPASGVQVCGFASGQMVCRL